MVAHTVAAMTVQATVAAEAFDRRPTSPEALAQAPALQKLAQSSDATAETMGGLGAWPSLALVCGYTIIAVGIAGWPLRSRDA